MNDFNFDLSNLNKQIEEAKAAAETKEEKIARLIILLRKIESELETVNKTLVNLLEHTLKYNPNSPLLGEIETKLQTVERLTLKIRKSRLNLNVHFI